MKPCAVRYVAPLLALLLLAACGSPAMTNDQIVAEHKKCEEAGMDSVSLVQIMGDGLTHRVECRPRGRSE